MLRLDFINVGYGDSILVRVIDAGKTLYTLLIDAGDTDDSAHYERGRIKTVDFLVQEGVERIDTLLLTHLHKDHVGGMPAVVSRFSIGQVFAGYYPPENAFFSTEKLKYYHEGALALALGAEAWHFSVKRLRENEVPCLLLADYSGMIKLTPDLTLYYLQGWDRGNSRQKEILDLLFQPGVLPAEQDLFHLDRFINNLSIVAILEYQGNRIALLGDVYLNFWRKHKIPERCRIVKLPHHGHADAVSAELLQRIDPEWIVISVSNDRTDNCPCASLEQMAGTRKIICTDAVQRLDSFGGKAVRFEIASNGISVEQMKQE